MPSLLRKKAEVTFLGSTRSHAWFWFSLLSPPRAASSASWCWVLAAPGGHAPQGLIQSVLRQEGPVSRGSICPLPVQQDGLQEGTGGPRWKPAAICREGSFRTCSPTWHQPQTEVLRVK